LRIPRPVKFLPAKTLKQETQKICALSRKFAEEQQPVRTDIVRKVCRDFDISGAVVPQNNVTTTGPRRSGLPLTDAERQMINAGISAYTNVAQHGTGASPKQSTLRDGGRIEIRK